MGRESAWGTENRKLWKGDFHNEIDFYEVEANFERQSERNQQWEPRIKELNAWGHIQKESRIVWNAVSAGTFKFALLNTSKYGSKTRQF